MSTTAAIIANSRTPASVVLRLTNSGAIDEVTPSLDRSTLEGQLLEGPLKTLLHRTADWSQLNFAGNEVKGDFVRLTMIDGGLSTELVPPNDTMVLYFTANALNFSFTFNGGEGPAPGEMLIELRAEHSIER